MIVHETATHHKSFLVTRLTANIMFIFFITLNAMCGFFFLKLLMQFTHVSLTIFYFSKVTARWNAVAKKTMSESSNGKLPAEILIIAVGPAATGKSHTCYHGWLGIQVNH